MWQYIDFIPRQTENGDFVIELYDEENGKMYVNVDCEETKELIDDLLA